MPTSVHDVFISFATADAVRARELCTELEERGLRCFFAPRDVTSGANFAHEIAEAIDGARVVALLVSESSLASPHVRREVSLAIDGKRPLAPFSLGCLLDAFPREWRYWLSVVQIVPFEGAEAAAEVIASVIERGRVEVVETTSIASPLPLSPGQATPTSREARPRQDVPPSALLRANAEITEFLERGEEIARLLSWLQKSTRLEAQLVVGPGGSGKTRLALELCRRAEAEGWATFFGNPDGAHGREAFAAELPTLVVLDYAETNPQVLVRLLTKLESSPATIARVLLLARSDGDWWTSLLLERPDMESLLTASSPLVLLSVAETPGFAKRLYESALHAFGERLSVQTGSVRARRTLDAHSTPLDIQVLALLDVLKARKGSAEDGGQSPAERLLNHERRYLRAAVKSDGIEGLDTEDLDRVLAVMSMLGAATEREALENLARVDLILERPVQKKLVRLLRRLYGRPGSYLGGLEPDAIAEELLAQVVDGSGRPSEMADFPKQALNGVAGPRLEQALTVLGRAAGRRHVQKALGELLDGLPQQTAVAALHVATRLERPQPLVAALRHGIASSVLRQHEVTALLEEVPEETIALAEVAADLCAALIQMDAVDSRFDAIPLLREASNRLSDVGRSAEATATVRRVVATLRASLRDDQGVIDLGAALSSLSNRLWEVGEPQEARLPAEESVALLTRAGAALREEAEPRKIAAAALNNLAFRRADLGDFEVARDPATEAVAGFRGVEQIGDFFVLSGLASALNNLVCVNNALGRFEDAVAAAAECVARRRTQTAEERDRFLPYLARALSNATIAYLGRGDDSTALEMGEEGVDLDLALNARHPLFVYDLATAALNLAVVHVVCGRNEKAISTLDLALATAERNPDGRLPDPRVLWTLQGMRSALRDGRNDVRLPLCALDGRTLPLQSCVPFALALEYKDL